jgi:hypothetical protein
LSDSLQKSDQNILKPKYHRNKGCTEWFDYFSEFTPFVVYSVKNSVIENSSKDAFLGGSPLQLSPNPEVSDFQYEWERGLKEARITEEDDEDDEVMSIPLECSLPNRDLQEFLRETGGDSLEDLKKYIPTEEDSKDRIIDDLLGTAEAEALKEIKGIHEEDLTNQEVTMFKPQYIQTEESLDRELFSS